jgi:hypothetical protein
MKSGGDRSTGLEASPEREQEATGLPWPRTWRGVYLFVLGCFCVWLGLLIALTFFYS